MKVLQITAPTEFTILDIPVPAPAPNEILVRVGAVTTCPQWDLHLRHNEPMFVGHKFVYPYPPGQPGHEATGEVEAIGSDVLTFRHGDRVSAWRDPGHGAQGCYAQYVCMKAENAIRVPAGLAYEATAPMELAMCVGASFLALREMNALSGKSVGVMGLGPAGLIAVQMARAAGAALVHGFDLNPARRALALTLGADTANDSRDNLSATFPSRPGAVAIDTGIDCIGARATVEYLMDRVEYTVALFGVQREEYTFALRHYRNLRLCGYPGHSRAAADYALELIETGLLKLKPLATHSLPLERYDEGIALLERQEAIKVAFRPWD